MRRRLATKLQATYLLVILIFLLIAGLYLHSSLKGLYVDQEVENLTARARLILLREAGFVAGVRDDALARRLKAATGGRLTFIGPDGKVWADSDEDSSVMENHLFRPEVQQALEDFRGVSIRHSATVDVDYLYVALPVRKGAELEGFLRIALPLTKLNDTLRAIRNKFLLTFLAASAVALIVGYVFSRTITRPIQALGRFARHLAEGRFSERLPVASRDEVGQLAEQLKIAASELGGTILLIEREKAKVEAILRSLRDAVLVIDDGGNIISTNPASGPMFGLTEAGLKGRTLTEVFRNPALDELFEKASHTGQSANGPVSLTTPRPIAVEVTVVPFEEETEDGTVPRFALSAHDITRTRRLEKMRVDFVANVSHELRSPLTAIRGFIETLQRGALSDPQAAERFLEVMGAQCDRMVRLLDDLLTLSDIELGRVALERRPVELSGVVAECFSALEPKAANGAVALEAPGLEGVPQVFADRDRLMQILINLVDNGIKFTPAGGRVEVSGRALPKEEGAAQAMVELLVADNGIGIPRQDLPRISERFYRVDKARSRELGGTGLGLAIVKHLVLAHGGTIAFESEVGRGTTVRIRLPRPVP